MSAIETGAPDFPAIKRRQQQAWASGDYAAVGARIVLIAELLAEAADLRAGEKVLDIATGSGNAALAAARCGCDVTGVDYVPALLERARVRARAEGLTVRFVEGDAEKLPFADASFDAVLSCVGVMFAPDQEQAAAELIRVCRPGGRIGLASWTPSSFVGEMFRTVGKHVPPPSGLKPPGLWGTADRLQELFADRVSRLATTRRVFGLRFPSPEDFVDFFRINYGPVRKTFEALDEVGRQALFEDLAALARDHDRANGGSLVLPCEYLEAVGVRVERGNANSTREGD